MANKHFLMTMTPDHVESLLLQHFKPWSFAVGNGFISTLNPREVKELLADNEIEGYSVSKMKQHKRKDSIMLGWR